MTISLFRHLGLLLLLTTLPGYGQESDGNPAEPVIHQAGVEASYGRWESAASLFREAAEMAPTNLPALLGLGRSLNELKQYGEAADAYEKALGLNQNLTNTWLWSANCCFSARRYEEAAHEYQKYLSLKGSGADGDAYYWFGRSLAQTGRFSEAEKACQRAISIDPTNADYIFELGFCQQRLHRQVEAIDTFKRALGLNSTNVYGWLSIGGCYYAEQNYPLAALAFRRATVLNANNDDAFDWLAHSLSESRNYGEAEEASRRAIEINPTNVHYYVQLAFSQDAENRYGDAVRTLGKAAAMDPNSALIFLRLGISQYHKKTLVLAMSSFQKSLQIEPTNTQSLYWLGNCYQQMGRHAEAVNAFERQLKLDPDDFGANLGCGMSLMFLGDFDGATARFEKAQAAKGRMTSLRPVLFSSYLLSAHYDKAYRLSPMGFSVGGGILVASYLAGLAGLLRYSFRIRPNLYPGIGFSFFWLGIFFEGQVAMIAFLGLLSLAGISLNPLAAILLAAVPVIYAANAAFPRQPWGGPYTWPPKFGTWQVIVAAFLGLAACMLINIVMETLYMRFTHSLMPDQDTIPFFKYALARNPVVGWLTIMVLVPIAEEIIFRGLLQGALEKYMSSRMAVVTGAVAFAVMHLQPLYMIPLFCFGLVLGAARARTGSLGLSIIIHMANNGLSLLMLKLAEQGS